MPVGRPCSLHGFNWALCSMHRDHGGTCGYSPDGQSTKCTGFQPCDPSALCTCNKCKDVAKLKDFAWKCEAAVYDYHKEGSKKGTLSAVRVCGHIDSELPLLRSSCPKCLKWDRLKVDFFYWCVTKGMITPEEWAKAHPEDIKQQTQWRDKEIREATNYLKSGK